MDLITQVTFKNIYILFDFTILESCKTSNVLWLKYIISLFIEFPFNKIYNFNVIFIECLKVVREQAFSVLRSKMYLWHAPSCSPPTPAELGWFVSKLAKVKSSSKNHTWLFVDLYLTYLVVGRDENESFAKKPQPPVPRPLWSAFSASLIALFLGICTWSGCSAWG